MSPMGDWKPRSECVCECVCVCVWVCVSVSQAEHVSSVIIYSIHEVPTHITLCLQWSTTSEVQQKVHSALFHRDTSEWQKTCLFIIVSAIEFWDWTGFMWAVSNGLVSWSETGQELTQSLVHVRYVRSTTARALTALGNRNVCRIPDLSLRIQCRFGCEVFICEGQAEQLLLVIAADSAGKVQPHESLVTRNVWMSLC